MEKRWLTKQRLSPFFHPNFYTRWPCQAGVFFQMEERLPGSFRKLILRFPLLNVIVYCTMPIAHGPLPIAHFSCRKPIHHLPVLCHGQFQIIWMKECREDFHYKKTWISSKMMCTFKLVNFAWNSSFWEEFPGKIKTRARATVGDPWSGSTLQLEDMSRFESTFLNFTFLQQNQNLIVNKHLHIHPIQPTRWLICTCTWYAHDMHIHILISGWRCFLGHWLR